MPDLMKTFSAQGVAIAGLEILDCQTATSGSTTVTEPESQRFTKVTTPDRREHTQRDAPASPERLLVLGIDVTDVDVVNRPETGSRTEETNARFQIVDASVQMRTRSGCCVWM